MVFTLNICVKELDGKYDRNMQTETLCVNGLSGSFKQCSDKANAKAKIFFDVCRLFLDLFRFRVRSVWADLYSAQMQASANEGWGKVMFLHLCVILFTKEGVSLDRGSVQGRGVCCQGDFLTRTVKRGGTHPTGMHSCFNICRYFR